MTIEELRSAMRRKVVPEEVVPQNVINCLIDEDAEPPKPDAFTFLMRLRALGIGSTDFVNLLEGCGAPEGVVARIKQNPAMNLQGLILTLENSELDSDDYTRMLLTARQVWERTLTLRLEKSETLSHIIDAYDSEDYEAPSREPEEPEDAPEPLDSDDDEYDSEEDFDPEYDEDMREMSFTAVFEKISEEIKAGKIKPSEPLEDDEENEKIEKFGSAAEDNDNEDDEADLSFTAAFDKIKAEKKLAFSEEQNKAEDNRIALEKTSEPPLEKLPEKTDTHSLVLDKLSGESEERHAKGVLKPEPPIEEPEPEEPEDIEESEPVEKPKKRSLDDLLKTARQLRRDRIVEEVRDDDDDEEDEPEEEYDEDFDDEDYDDEEFDEDEQPESKQRSGINKGAIIWAASGAAILICAGVIIGLTVGKKNGGLKSLGYAKDGAEVFQKIAEAYSAETPGGETPSELSPDYSTLFGDLLISSENGSTLGSFSIGTELYSVTEEAISANIVENGTIRTFADVKPPEKSRFVAAFEESGKLYALFSGKQSGYVKVSGGKAEYTVRQDGVLTDYEYADGEMRLGTVYTPVFTETFTIEDESTYLPRTGTTELSVIPAENIVMTETAGYSYGVSAGYSIENGARKDACAVIGDPVAASADGRFAVNDTTADSAKGLLITTSGEKPEVQTTEKLLRAAFYKEGGAILEEKISAGSGESGENSAESGANTVTLLNAASEPASILSGVPETITGMWFDGGLLTINGIGNSILRVDCTDPAKPEPLTLRSAFGVAAGGAALTFETNGTSLVITRHDLANGKAAKICEYAKELPPEQLVTVSLGDPKTAVISDGTSGIAYSYFDGVSVVSEYVVFASGLQPNVETLFDDSTGFTAAFANNGRISAVCGEGVKHLT